MEEIQRAKACGCDVTHLEEALLELIDRFEQINMVYGDGRPVTAE